jgi:hypothetical protein
MVGRDGSTVAHPAERFEGQVDDVSARAAARVRHEADAAGIAFAQGVVERPDGHGTSQGSRVGPRLFYAASRRRRGVDAD